MDSVFLFVVFFFFSSRRRHTRLVSDWSSDVCSSDLKGQLARTGPGLPGWFEGGQTPIHMRIPKMRGFKNRFRVEFVAVNVDQLANYEVDGKVTPDTLAAKGLVRPDAKVKVPGDGVVGDKLEVHAHAVSATAKQKIEAAGGSIVLIK